MTEGLSVSHSEERKCQRTGAVHQTRTQKRPLKVQEVFEQTTVHMAGVIAAQ